jgi:hypothetical protein
MPELDFPNNPAKGDQYVGTNGARYQWDGAVWDLASITPGTAAGGDLMGSYPNPDIAPGVVGTIELQTNVVNRLPPTPTMPADGGKVLTVTPVSGVFAWALPVSNVWGDIAAHSTVKPLTAGRSIELDPQTALWFGDSTTPCPAVRTPNQDIIVQSAVGRTAWLQSGQSGGILGITPTSASLSVDLALAGGLKVSQYIGGSPAAGSLQFFANQLQLRVAGAWQNVYPAAGGGGGGIPEAPNDGQLYGRKSTAWSVVPTPPAGLIDAPVDGTLYGRLNAAWASVTQPTTLPPSGPASGDLTGSYPNPSLGIIQSAKVRLVGRGSFFSGPGGASVAVNDSAHDASFVATLPSWSLDFGNDLGQDSAAVRRRPANAGGNAYTALMTVNPDGTIRATADPVNVLDLVTKRYADAHAGGGGAVKQVVAVAIPMNLNITNSAWGDILTISITTTGGWVVLICSPGWSVSGGSGGYLEFGWGRDAVSPTVVEQNLNYSTGADFSVPATSPLSGPIGMDHPPAGAHVYHLITICATPNALQTQGYGTGMCWAVELA